MTLKIRHREIVHRGGPGTVYGRYSEYQVYRARGGKIVGRFDLLSQAQGAHPDAEVPATLLERSYRRKAR